MNAQWVVFGPWRGSRVADGPCVGARTLRPARRGVETVEEASHTGDAAAGHTGSCRTIAAVEDRARRAGCSAGADMRRRGCGGRASEAAEEAGDIDAHHAVFPDGRGRQVALSSPASWGRCDAVAFTQLDSRPGDQAANACEATGDAREQKHCTRTRRLAGVRRRGRAEPLEMRSRFLAGVGCVARARRAGSLEADEAARVVGGHCLRTPWRAVWRPARERRRAG